MSESKKAVRVVAIVGFMFIIVGALVLLIGTRIPHYTATITKITDTYTTRKSGKNRRKRYNERVTLEYTDGSGTEKTASNVRITRNSEIMLPKVGDEIEVKEILGVAEYQTSLPIIVFIACLITGTAFFISIPGVRKKYRQTEQ